MFITQRYPNQVEKAIFSPEVFWYCTQLFLFLFDLFEEIGYQKPPMLLIHVVQLVVVHAHVPL